MIWVDNLRDAVGAAAVLSGILTFFETGAFAVTVGFVVLWLMMEDA